MMVPASVAIALAGSLILALIPDGYFKKGMRYLAIACISLVCLAHAFLADRPLILVAVVLVVGCVVAVWGSRVPDEEPREEPNEATGRAAVVTSEDIVSISTNDPAEDRVAQLYELPRWSLREAFCEGSIIPGPVGGTVLVKQGGLWALRSGSSTLNQRRAKIALHQWLLETSPSEIARTREHLDIPLVVAQALHYQGRGPVKEALGCHLRPTSEKSLWDHLE